VLILFLATAAGTGAGTSSASTGTGTATAVSAATPETTAAGLTGNGDRVGAGCDATGEGGQTAITPADMPVTPLTTPAAKSEPGIWGREGELLLEPPEETLPTDGVEPLRRPMLRR